MTLQVRKNPAAQFVGWWVAVPRPNGEKQVGQIIEVHDIWMKVRDEEGDDVLANAAVLDSRFGIHLYQSQREALKAVQL